MKPRQSVQLSDEVHGQLKVRSAQLRRSVRDLVHAALDAYLGVCPTCRQPWPTTTVPSFPPPVPAVLGTVRNREPPTRLDAVGTTGGKATVETVRPVPPASTPVADATCRRCHHLKNKHWLKGCVAGCSSNCNEARYLA